MAEPCELTAVEARRLIGARGLSPVELVESCIRRIETWNPHVNAVVTTCYERARAEARRAEAAVTRGDPLPPLHGLPVGIKDLDDTAGVRTTYGSLLYRDHVPERDSLVVAAIRAAGGIVVGKTNTPEFGAGGNTSNALFGPTRNPFALALTCGGSSGGSGVALATGMMPLCQGSDTGGSLRLPATFNGVVAHRPSPGVVPTEGRDLALTFYQSQGPMGRTVADASLLLAAMARRSRRDPMAWPLDPAQFERIEPVDLARLRVVVSEDLGCATVDRRVRETFRARVARFRSVFAACEERSPDFGTMIETFWRLRGEYMLARHAERIDRYGPEVNPNVRSNYQAALRMELRDVALAHREQLRLYQRFQDFLEGFDALLCPGVTVLPFPYDQLYPTEIDGRPMENYVHWAALTSSLTVVGHPVVAIPCGLDPQGTPFGIQVVGPMYGDRVALGIAHALEQLFETDPVLARPVPRLERTLAGHPAGGAAAGTGPGGPR
jgi:Asp-tRNA(Asn)/Glu-tRNA(Gln) amidotransferase A subunit family amidase